MEQDHRDKGPERVEGVAFALRELVLPRRVVMDFPIGDIALRVIPTPPASGLAVVDPLVVEEEDVPSVVVEAAGGVGSIVNWCKSYSL
jgi:hypothetical protein